MVDTYSGIAFYDDPGVDERYHTSRAMADNPNRTLEEPFVMRFLGGVAGHDVLDLGCGDAAIGRRLLALGARSYTAVDGSHRMVARARAALAGTVGTVECVDLEEWDAEPGVAFDTVLSRMALHYIADLDRLLSAVRRSCRPGAQLVFSVEHPVVTSSYTGDRDGFVARAWTVRDYFREGARSCSWLGTRVRKYHRTLGTYCGMLARNGFALHALSEGEPLAASFADERHRARYRDVPMYAVVRAVAISGTASPEEFPHLNTPE